MTRARAELSSLRCTFASCCPALDLGFEGLHRQNLARVEVGGVPDPVNLLKLFHQGLRHRSLGGLGTEPAYKILNITSFAGLDALLDRGLVPGSVKKVLKEPPKGKVRATLQFDDALRKGAPGREGEGAPPSTTKPVGSQAHGLMCLGAHGP